MCKSLLGYLQVTTIAYLSLSLMTIYTRRLPHWQLPAHLLRCHLATNHIICDREVKQVGLIVYAKDTKQTPLWLSISSSYQIGRDYCAPPEAGFKLCVILLT